MSSSGLVGHGTTITIGGTAIAELTNIDGLELNVADVNFSTHDEDWDDFKPGRQSISDLSIEGNFVAGDSGQDAMYDALMGKTTLEFIITAPDSSYTWTFNGYVKAFKTAHPDNDKVGFTATIKPIGTPVLAVSASNDLSGLASSVGTLTGPLTASIYEYVVPVITGTTGVTITPTAAQGVITVNGTIVVSGQASGSIALGAAGSVTEIIVKVKESGKVAKVYTIWVARAAS